MLSYETAAFVIRTICALLIIQLVVCTIWTFVLLLSTLILGGSVLLSIEINSLNFFDNEVARVITLP